MAHSLNTSSERATSACGMLSYAFASGAMGVKAHEDISFSPTDRRNGMFSRPGVRRSSKNIDLGLRRRREATDKSRACSESGRSVCGILVDRKKRAAAAWSRPGVGGGVSFNVARE